MAGIDFSGSPLKDVFQKRIDETFEHIPGIEIVADDIMILSTTVEEYNAILRKIFNPFATKGAVFYYTEGKSGMKSLQAV